MLTQETNHSGVHSQGGGSAAAAVVLKTRMFVQYMLIHQALHAQPVIRERAIRERQTLNVHYTASVDGLDQCRGKDAALAPVAFASISLDGAGTRDTDSNLF